MDRQFGKLRARAADYTRDQIARMVDVFESAILPLPTPEARPTYDPSGIGFAVRQAVGKFQGPWLVRLGTGTYEGFSKEHWSRVKALNRRIADARRRFKASTTRLRHCPTPS